MNKKQRQQVFEKFGGKCAYCGEALPAKGWHVDHFEPIVRRREWDRGGHWRDTKTKAIIPEAEAQRMFSEAGGQNTKDVPIEWFGGGWINAGCENPEKDTMDNYMPACASCNINKHSMSLENFRELISGFINSLNRYSVQYKVAKRYGLLSEISKPVQFYFETVTSS